MIDALLADLDELLACFVDQERDGTLLVACDQVAGPIVTLAIDGVDQRHPNDLGVAFPGSFASAAEYVDKAVAAVVDGLAAAEAEAAATPDLLDAGAEPEAPDGLDDFGDFGGVGIDDIDDETRRARTREHLAAANDRSRSPAARLLALCEALRLHVPARGGRLLLGVIPSVIDDRDGYAALAGELVHARLPGLRLVLREPPAAPASAPDLALADACIHRFELPITPQTFVDSANALADDPAAPRQQRATALLQVAFHDLGHGHSDRAERRFGELIDLFVGDGAEVDDTSDTGAGSASEAATDHDSHPTANEPSARASSDSEAIDDHHCDAAADRAQREARSPAEPADNDPKAPPPENAASEESETAAPPLAPTDAAVLALALYGLGELRAQAGDHVGALDRLLVSWRTLADDAPPVLRHMLAAALMNTTIALQRPREARVFAAIAAESAIRAQSPESAAEALCTHGDLDRELGDLEAARDAWQAGLALLADDSRELRESLERRLENTTPLP